MLFAAVKRPMIGSRFCFTDIRYLAKTFREHRSKAVNANTRIAKEVPEQNDIHAGIQVRQHPSKKRRHHRHARRDRPRRLSPSIAPRAPIPSSGTSQGLSESVEAILALSRPSTIGYEEEAVEPEIIVERLQNLADEAMTAKLERSRPGAMERCREADPDPDARPSLEGASCDARRAAPGDPPSELRAEEADRRI